MKKRIFVGLIATMVLLSSTLASCSKSNTNTSDSSNSTGETTTIKVWGMGEEGKLLPKIASEYESQNPGIKVEVQAIPWDQAHEKLITAVAGEGGPDIVTMGTSWIPEFADAGALVDLTSYTEKYPNLAQQNFFDSSLETAVYDGEYVGAPWYVDTRVLFYRTDLLEEVGFEKGPSNWEELKEASTKLAEKGDQYYGIALDPKDQFFATTFAWQNGTDVIKDGKSMVNTKEFVESVTYLNSFFKEGLAPIGSDMDTIQAFKEGIYPMFISGPWMVNMIGEQAPELEGKWAVRVLPGNKTNTSFVGGANLVLWESSKNKDAAVDFMNYLLTPETQVKWFEISNTLPSQKSAWDIPTIANNEKIAVFGEQLKDAKSSPFLVYWENVAQEIVSSVERINLDNADIQKELDKLNEKIDKIIKE